MIRYRIIINGKVQGIGFRPAVYRYAAGNKLSGFIINTSGSVIIEMEGPREKIKSFIKNLPAPEKWAKMPLPNLKISSINAAEIPCLEIKGFTINPSIDSDNASGSITPDIGICPDCLAEMSDRTNRRYLYPFINCSNCGPRYTIIRKMPYDRANTTMSKFKMCPQCREEYNNPENRRFHAEPISCFSCGPQLQLIQLNKGIPKILKSGNTATIPLAIKLLQSGKILAIKSIGGFHLACDAFNNTTVKKLRSRKYREDKPFAVMMKDINTVHTYCAVSLKEKETLVSYRKPIVLLEKNKTTKLSGHIAPGNNRFGVMLPYTPLHYLLFAKMNVMVMTSANISDEPIAFDNKESYARLKNIADYFLVNNRDIHTRCDDSVTRIMKLHGLKTRDISCFGIPGSGILPVPIFIGAGRRMNNRELVIRRSRGYVPDSIKISGNLTKPILACGAELKNTFSFGKNNYIYTSHHIGDLENSEVLNSYETSIEQYKQFFNTCPEYIVHDMHPEYMSTKYAAKYSKIHKIKSFPVQHHHAHIASCMLENGLTGKDKVIGIAFDGLGYGDDTKFWGCEFMVCTYKEYNRVAHMKYVPLPGGNLAIKEPWRMGCIYLRDAFGDDFINLGIQFTGKLDKYKWPVIKNMVDTRVNSPEISSMGRLFDGVSAILGLRTKINYEGQSAIELEQLINPEFNTTNYKFSITESNIIDFRPVIKDIVTDVQNKLDLSIISTKFHLSVINMALEMAERIKTNTGIQKIALSGGVFQNEFLLKNLYNRLILAGYEVHIHGKLPANDACISAGQIMIAKENVA